MVGFHGRIFHDDLHKSCGDSSDVIKDIINSDPDRFLPVSWLSAFGKKYKHGSTSDNVEEEFCTGRNKKRRKMMKYDRNRAYKCVMSDWLGAVPWFNDKQFERSF